MQVKAEDGMTVIFLSFFFSPEETGEKAATEEDFDKAKFF